jgi:predicted DNA-binding transcriptional regulator AlpA
MLQKVELLTLAEVADVFGVSRQAILNWVDAGQFPKPVRISKRYVRWVGEDLRHFIESCKNHDTETCRR